MAPAATPEPSATDRDPRVDAAVLDGGVALVTLHHPRVHNALTQTMWVALGETVARLDADPTVAAIVLHGAGEHFSSGADITDLPDDAEAFGALLERTETTIAQSATPVVAAIAGTCVGGGCGLAVAAHQRFATSSARFGITASRLGIVYPARPTRRLVELVGPSTARRMLTAGEILDADWALRVGLVDELVVPSTQSAPGAAVLQRALDHAALLARRSAVSVRAALALTGAGTAPVEAEGVAAADYREGRAAFLAGRAPQFPSRQTPATAPPA